MGAIVPLNHPGLGAPAPRPEPARDRFGRYLIPDPVTGEERAWTRATTWAATVADTFALTRWEVRQSAIGLARRNDLLVGVAAINDPDSRDGKKQLDELLGQAKDAAGARVRSTLGTALHAFAEATDAGRSVNVPPPFNADIAAYRRATRDIEISRNYIERICVVSELGVAGTLDRVVRLPGAVLPMIGDLKTGRDLSFSWPEIAIQLALYAHADTAFDLATRRHSKMLLVDHDHALVMHVPAGEARCQLYLVDIAAGWDMARICGIVRKWRKRKDIAQQLWEER